MRTYDRFVNDKISIPVQCYDEFGGSVSSFKIGDKVPLTKINNDFEISANYGEHYNIYNYMISDTIILIRYGIFVCLKSIKTITDDEIKNVLCIDKQGNELDINTKQEYIDLRKKQQEDEANRVEFYRRVCNDFDKFINKPNTKINYQGIVDNILAKLTYLKEKRI